MSSTSRVDQSIYEDGDVLCHWDLPKKVKNKLKFPHEPERPNKQYIVRGECPFNAEPPLRQLVEKYITDKDVFFKRNHGPIPLIDENTHKVSVCGLVPKPFDLSMDAIKNNYSKLRILAALQCAGNRRNGLDKVKTVKGVIWGPGTIANSYWAGAPLREILIEAGLSPNGDGWMGKDFHIWMESYGPCEEDKVYGSSIPLETAMDPCKDVILAYEMNDEIMSRDHGFPVRMICPGIIGARSVKYLAKIEVREKESPAFYQQRDYKILPPEANDQNLEEYWDRCESIQEMNVQSVICTPSEQSPLTDSNIVKGYAISGGGRKIIRVEVSLDMGETWLIAKLHQEKTGHGYWSWCLWQVEVKSLKNVSKIICRAWDSSSNTQPCEPIWNYRGVMNNSWDIVQLMQNPKI